MTFSLQPQTTKGTGNYCLFPPCAPLCMQLCSNRGLVNICEHKTVITQPSVWSAPCFWVTRHSDCYYVSIPPGSPTATPGKKLCANLTWNCEYATVKKFFDWELFVLRSCSLFVWFFCDLLLMFFSWHICATEFIAFLLVNLSHVAGFYVLMSYYFCSSTDYLWRAPVLDNSLGTLKRAAK